MERDKTLKIHDPRTVKNSLRRSLLLHSFPNSKVTFVRHNTEANMCTSQTVSVDSVAGTSPTDCVRLVLPSQWVKLDVACLQFYRSVFPEVHDVDGCTRTQTDVNIEDTLAVTDRSLSFLRKNILRGKFHGTHAACHTSPGDMISFPCSRFADLRGNDISGWHEWQAETATTGTHQQFFVQGVVGRTFGVGFPESDELDTDTNVDPKLPPCYVDIEDLIMEECRKANRSISAEPSRTTESASSSQATLPCRPTVTDLALFPGDVITFIRPTEHEITEGMCCIFHASPIAATHGRAAERMVWLCVEKTGDDVSAMYTACSTNVVAMPFFIDNERKLQAIRRSRHPGRCANSGFLPNGDRFLVYRAALYGDGFSQNKSSPYSRSVAGVYMLPLGLPATDRTSAHAVRALCLTPHGIKAEDVFNKIIDDVCECARNGVTGVDPLGRRVRIYIDVMQFIGDFPQVAKYTDVLGHTADSMCSLCTIRKRKNRPVPVNNFSNHIHSGRVGYMRFDARAHAIRAARPHEKSFAYSACIRRMRRR